MWDEEGGDSASSKNSETALIKWKKERKRKPFNFRCTNGSLTIKLGGVVRESTHVEKEVHTNVVGKVSKVKSDASLLEIRDRCPRN